MKVNVKFKDWMHIKESVNLYVKDYDYSNDIQNLFDLTTFLSRKILYQKQPTGKTMGFETIIPDGDYWIDGDLTINFYTIGWSENQIKNIVQGIKFYLEELKIKYNILPPRESQRFDSEVIKIKLQNLPQTSNTPPSLNLSNANTQLIFGDLLKFEPQDGGFFNINPRELLMK